MIAPHGSRHYLRERGVGPGGFVGLQMRNGTEYVEAMLAVFKLRAVPVNIDYRYVTDELAGLYSDARRPPLLVDSDLLARVRDAEVRLPEPIPLVITVGDAGPRARDFDAVPAGRSSAAWRGRAGAGPLR